jgi:hypothetical protein
MGRDTGCKYLHTRMTYFGRRDYENATDIPNKTYGDPGKDLEESFARKNNLGNLHKIYTYRSWDNNEYLKNLVNHMNGMGLTYFIFSMISSIGFFLIIFAVLIYQMLELRNYYSLIFNLSEYVLRNEIKICKLELGYVSQVFENVGFPSTLDNLVEVQKIHVKNKETNRTRIAMNKQGLSFGLWYFISLCAMVCFGVIAIELTNFQMMTQSINVSLNTLECYILGVEIWNSYFTYATMALATVSFNNTYKAWDSDHSTLDMTKYYSDYVNKKVIANMTRLLDRNMGNITEEMQTMFWNSDFCESEMTIFPWCGSVHNGAFKNGIIEILKLLRGFWDDWIRMFEDMRGTRAGIERVLNFRKAVDIMPVYNKIMSKLYYSIVVPATDGLFGEFKSNLDR